MKRPLKIAFLHLDEIHHINHFAPVAVSLSRLHDVSIVTYPGNHTYLHATLEQLKGENVPVLELPTHWFRALTDRLKKRALPRKGFWIKKNLPFLFENFDAFVFTDFFQGYFVNKRGEGKFPKFIKMTHGTPGRAYVFKKVMLDFDFQLLPGTFYAEELQKRQLLAPHHAVVGYPKLDSVALRERKPIFSNDKPTVLYNPHFSAPFSSWHHHGLEILEYFYHQQEFNLIFAPHINLFKHKGGARQDTLPEKYREAKHMFVDLGSNASVDMTYIKAADLYLGDVSSQVYEFIIEPRPCLFFNAENRDWQQDTHYRFWKCGDVVTSVEEMKKMLPRAFQQFVKYKPTQQRITDENFHSEVDCSPSQRAARAISDYLEHQKSTT
ncbi:MAG: hypothetical protein CMC08_06095 [Flavobacteriaceae bacterium]|nr:hypothetical protein [Flavobacteriaceae bacterium]